MKCIRIQRIVLECDEGELSQDILSHLESCAACGKQYRQACFSRRLVALKRFEMPSELRREACLAQLHDRLADLEHEHDRAGYRLHPALRYGMAAAVVAMVAAHLAVLGGADRLHSPVTQSELRLRTFEEFLADRDDQIERAFPSPPLFTTYPTFPTNAVPARAHPKSVFFTGD